MNLHKNLLPLLLIFTITVAPMGLNAQPDQAPPQNWFHLDAKQDGYHGVSTNRLYQEIVQDRKTSTVVVAVIDSGVDFLHEDLLSNMWVNQDEIPGNKKDDDGNGYIDDMHGWNFIGGPDGKNVEADNLEITRLLRKYHKDYANVSSEDGLSKKEVAEYKKYLDLKEKVEKAREKGKTNYDNFKQRKEDDLAAIKAVDMALGQKGFSLENIENLEAGSNEELARGIEISKMALLEDGTTTLKQIKEKIVDSYQPALDYFGGQYKHYYNMAFDPRDIVNDNYKNQTEKKYGNNDYRGPDASHGTHVAGIIGAIRNNGKGMDGIAPDVQIMTVRAVPDGDERDKDVANAIRYAVDNGASIINMSFGKSYVWNKEVVDDAVKYAVKNGVLLVHAAGNDGKNNDNTDNYPNDTYDKSGLFGPKKAKTWIEVGALNHKKGEDFAAPFSNYGKENVDIFAPGMAIYSTIPGNEYASFQGTSMASPVVAGVAALVWSYFPELSAKQVHEIVLSTATPIHELVKVPGDPEQKKKFSDLSSMGGVVNAYEALLKASKTKGKRKKSKAYNPDAVIYNEAKSQQGA